MTLRAGLLQPSEPGKFHIEIAVSDTGIGIPEAKKNQIFEMFTQADSSISRRFGGTGLGLAITRKLVQMQNGTLALRSVPGELIGTRN